MPELPEVERFRQLLLPLVVPDVPVVQQSQSTKKSLLTSQNQQYRNLQIDAFGEHNINRIKITASERQDIAKLYCCTDVLRKGKQLCLVLTNRNKNGNSNSIKYLYLHMGMTGRIHVPGKMENWGGKKLHSTTGTTSSSEEKDNFGISSKEIKPTKTDNKEDETLPPKYTILVFTSNNYTAYFCDPRKFGSCYLAEGLAGMDELAPDVLTCNDTNIVQEIIVPALSGKSRGIKAILLDQKKACSGVGNWVADEVLYQCGMHPDQTYLTRTEATALWQTLQSIVQTAVDALNHDTHYPEHWLFGYRWTKKKASHDALGRNISFLQSGGRTSAIVATIQKQYKRKRLECDEETTDKPLAHQEDVARDNETVPTIHDNMKVQSNGRTQKKSKHFLRGEGEVPATDVPTNEAKSRRRSPRHLVTPL